MISVSNISLGQNDSGETKGLSLEFISEVTSITPDKPFYVGLKIKHAPGFHTYWKNPGVVGIPTKMRWSLPTGFKASEIQWPYPQTSKMAHYPCFGYKRDVLLIVKITPPSELSVNQVTLTTDTNWMCCSSTCYPGFKKLSLTLPINQKDKKQHLDPHLTKAFQEAKASVPTQTNKIQAKLLSPNNSPDIEVQITTLGDVIPLYVFNSDGQTTPDLPFSLNKKDNHTWTFRAKRSEFSSKTATTFPFILKTSTGHYEIIAQ